MCGGGLSPDPLNIYQSENSPLKDATTQVRMFFGGIYGTEKIRQIKRRRSKTHKKKQRKKQSSINNYVVLSFVCDFWIDVFLVDVSF